MPIKRYHGQPLPIVVAFPSNPLTVYGFDYADIVDISMNLKKDLATDADNLYLEKLQSVGGEVTLDTTNNKFSMEMNDYTNLVIGDSYYLVLAVDVGASSWIELKLDPSSRRVDITADENRS